MKIPPVFIFGALLLLLDVPFISTVMKSRYEALGMRLSSPLYAFLAYFAMTLAWFLIKGDVKKGALMGFVLFGMYAFTLSAVLPGYTKTIGLTEIVWGTILYTLATIGTNKITSLM
jgi:uncharacterized membrane protein